MTTPSGTISMRNVNEELNRSQTSPINFSDQYVRQLAKRLSGSFSMSDLRNKTRSPGNTGGGGTAVHYLESPATFWRFANNLNAISIWFNGTMIAEQMFQPSNAAVLVAGTRTYYRHNLVRTDGISGTSFYQMSWVDG